VKSVQEFYAELRRVLVEHSPDVVAEFDSRSKSDDPRVVFMWLEDLSRAKALPEAAEPLLTDFFFSIH